MSQDQQFLLALATLCATTLMSLIATVVGVRKSQDNSAKLDTQAEKLQEVHVLVNDNLLTVKADAKAIAAMLDDANRRLRAAGLKDSR